MRESKRVSKTGARKRRTSSKVDRGEEGSEVLLRGHVGQNNRDDGVKSVQAREKRGEPSSRPLWSAQDRGGTKTQRDQVKEENEKKNFHSLSSPLRSAVLNNSSTAPQQLPNNSPTTLQQLQKRSRMAGNLSNDDFRKMLATPMRSSKAQDPLTSSSSSSSSSTAVPSSEPAETGDKKRTSSLDSDRDNGQKKARSRTHYAKKQRRSCRLVVFPFLLFSSLGTSTVLTHEIAERRRSRSDSKNSAASIVTERKREEKERQRRMISVWTSITSTQR